MACPLDWGMVVCIIPHMDSRAIIKKLEQRGWRHVRTVGSHHIFEHPDYPEIVTVPHPKKDLPPETLRGILKTGRIERQ